MSKADAPATVSQEKLLWLLLALEPMFNRLSREGRTESSSKVALAAGQMRQALDLYKQGR